MISEKLKSTTNNVTLRKYKRKRLSNKTNNVYERNTKKKTTKNHEKTPEGVITT